MNSNSILFATGSLGTKLISGLPLVAPATIAVIADDLQADEYARQLVASVEALLQSVSSQVTASISACSHKPADVPQCSICNAANRQKLLLAVSSGKRGWLGGIPHQDWWLGSEADRRVLPLLPKGTHPEKLLPDAVSKMNACFWQDSITECRNAVLRAVGITPEAYRIFISYRRLETEPLAEQLFDELTRKNFSVFLDTISVPPSVPFQRRLGQELLDKGMVVLLESEQFISQWTQEELDICKRYQIGILGISMPHGMNDKTVPQVKSILFREPLVKSDFVNAPTPISENGKMFLKWGRLKDGTAPSACARVVQRIRDAHDQAWFRRRLEMRDAMTTFLKDAKPRDFQWRADGLLFVDGGTRQYAVWLMPRPAELPDFHLTHVGSQQSPQTKGVLIGPRDLLEPERLLRHGWLSGLCGFSSHDPGEMIDVADKMARGDL